MFRLLLLLAIFMICSCQRYIETDWLIPQQSKELSQQILLSNNYKRILIDVPFFKKIMGDSSISFQFEGFENDICLHQIWEINGDFNNENNLRKYLKRHDIRISDLCNNLTLFFAQHRKKQIIYLVRILENGTLRITYDYPLL